MEKKTAALLVLVVAASLAVTATAAYAMGRQTLAAAGTGYNSGYGMGPSMMGGNGGFRGGLMGAWNGPSYTYQHMQECGSSCWNASAVP